MPSAVDLAKRELVKVLKELAAKYRVALSVTCHSSNEDVLKAYRKVSLKAHPDKGGDAEDFPRLSIAIGVVASAATHAQDLCLETVGTLQFSGHASGKVAKKIGRISLRGPWVAEWVIDRSLPGPHDILLHESRALRNVGHASAQRLTPKHRPSRGTGRGAGRGAAAAPIF